MHTTILTLLAVFSVNARPSLLQSYGLPQAGGDGSIVSNPTGSPTNQGIGGSAVLGTGSLQPCSGEQVHNALGQCVLPEISRNIFVYTAPNVITNPGPRPNIPKPEVHYNLVFVKTADLGQQNQPIIVPPPQQKTLVYVLSKKQQQGGNNVIQAPYSPAANPEVFYVNYGQGDNPLLPGGVDLQTALSSAFTQGQNFNGQNQGNNFVGAGQNQGQNFVGTGQNQGGNFVGNSQNQGNNFVGSGHNQGDNFVSSGQNQGNNFVGTGQNQGNNFVGTGQNQGNNFVGNSQNQGNNFVGNIINGGTIPGGFVNPDINSPTIDGGIINGGTVDGGIINPGYGQQQIDNSFGQGGIPLGPISNVDQGFGGGVSLLPTLIDSGFGQGGFPQQPDNNVVIHTQTSTQGQVGLVQTPSTSLGYPYPTPSIPFNPAQGSQSRPIQGSASLSPAGPPTPPSRPGQLYGAPN